SPPSTADAELVYDGAVALRRPDPEVFEKAAALADQHQQTPPRVVVLGVLLEVVRQAVDALREERDLHFGRACIALVGAELLDQTLLSVDGKRHRWPPNRHTPGSLSSHAGAGSKTSFFVRRYARSVSRRAREVKLWGRSGGGPSGSDVERDLRLEGVDAWELSLLAQPAKERQGDPLVVEIAREIEHMSFDSDLGLAERRPEADVHDCLMLMGAERQPADVDPHRKPQRPLRLDVGRGEPEGSAPAGPADHGAPDRIGAAQERGRGREIASLQRRADLGRRHG